MVDEWAEGQGKKRITEIESPTLIWLHGKIVTLLRLRLAPSSWLPCHLSILLGRSPPSQMNIFHVSSWAFSLRKLLFSSKKSLLVFKKINLLIYLSVYVWLQALPFSFSQRRFHVLAERCPTWLSSTSKKTCSEIKKNISLWRNELVGYFWPDVGLFSPYRTIPDLVYTAKAKFTYWSFLLRRKWRSEQKAFVF